MLYVYTEPDGRVSAAVESPEYADESYTAVQEPEGWGIEAAGDYRLEGGALVYDPVEPDPEPVDYSAQIPVALALFARKAAPSMTDAEALSVSAFFPAWEPDEEYAAGDILSHSDGLYRVAQAHTSQEQWKPGESGTEALYTRITLDPETGIEEWKRPTGSHDAYNVGDRVKFDGKIYESTINGNSWSPLEYPQGWKEVS